MTTAMPTSPTPPDLDQGWGARGTAAICETCNAAYLLPEADAPALMERCPRCYRGPLTPLPLDEENPRFSFTPELFVPFGLDDARMETAVNQFAGRIPYPPEDLNPGNLRQRARRMVLPVWLVDTQAQALWNAEAGFDYEVVSHRDQFQGGGWSSQQVKEGRIRWEPRVGRLARSYTNVSAPAMEDHNRLNQQLGDFIQSAAKPYRPDAFQQTILRVPDRTPQDAWSDARAAIQAAAAEECRQAAGADHIRQFAWQPEFSQTNWTLLLLPIFSTVYFDDEHKPQPVWINAQTGQVTGKRRASSKRATRSAAVWLAAAIIVFIISLALTAATVVLPALIVLSVIGFTAALLMGIGAAVPLFRVWSFNRQQEPS